LVAGAPPPLSRSRRSFIVQLNGGQSRASAIHHRERAPRDVVDAIPRITI
jgi:hypothetical protein